MGSRGIKALSEQQMAELRSGRGMSLALAAELNGFPGPAHVLELAEQLDLSAEQRQRTQALFMQMGQRARELGELVIAAEVELDRLFKNRTADAASVDDSTAKIARVQGQLRATHLSYQLAMVEVLSAEQVARYNRLRGYAP